MFLYMAIGIVCINFIFVFIYKYIYNLLLDRMLQENHKRYRLIEFRKVFHVSSIVTTILVTIFLSVFFLTKKEMNQIVNKTYGYLPSQTIEAMANTSNGYVMVGNSQNMSGLILKVDHEGNSKDNYIIKKDYLFKDVVVDQNDHIVVIGQKMNNFKNQGVIIRYDQYGKEIWVTEFDRFKHVKFQSITMDYKGDYIIAGSVMKDDGSVDALLVKYSKIGALIWYKTYGGNGDDFFSSVMIDEDTIVVAGASNSTDNPFTENVGGYDGIVVKLSLYGEVIWSKGLGTMANEYLNDITINPHGEYIVVGKLSNQGTSQFGYESGLIGKFDSDGSFSWTKIYSDQGDNYFTSVTVDKEHNVWVGGNIVGDHYHSASFLVKYDYSGNYLTSYELKDLSQVKIVRISFNQNHDLVLSGNKYYDVFRRDIYFTIYEIN